MSVITVPIQVKKKVLRIKMEYLKKKVRCYENIVIILPAKSYNIMGYSVMLLVFSQNYNFMLIKLTSTPNKK